MVSLGPTAGVYDYLLAHYGGLGGGFAEVWYVGNLSGTISISATGLGHGLSGWTLFTAAGGAVPDGGTTNEDWLLTLRKTFERATMTRIGRYQI
jgi:hypothetical protein